MFVIKSIDDDTYVIHYSYDKTRLIVTKSNNINLAKSFLSEKTAKKILNNLNKEGEFKRFKLHEVK